MDGDIVKDVEQADDGPTQKETHAKGSNTPRHEDIVDFDGPNDPQNPRNWPRWYKWNIVILISILSLVVNLAILMCAPATSYILQEFHTTNTLESTLLVSIWELGEVVGPLFIAPLCESFGRLPTYHAANIAFILFTVAAAESTSMGMLIAMRFFLGMTVASTVINPSIVGDMFEESQRGKAMSFMGMIPFVAPCLGPTIGGFVAEAEGWRWTFWVIAIIAAPLQILFLFFYRETYVVRILQLKAARLRKETGNTQLKSKYELTLKPSAMIRESIRRPLKMLVFCPAVLLVGLCGAIGMSLTYVIITSLTEVYEDTYRFEKQLVGLTYFGLGIGMVASTLTIGPYLDRRYRDMKKLEEVEAESPKCRTKPEDRLTPMVLGSILIPCGIIAFGWSAEYKLHWVVPLVWSAFVGYGYVAVAIAAWTYLTDAFGIHSASAQAATVVLRNAGAAALPLAGPALRGKLGIGWEFSVLGLVGLVAVPIPVVLIRFGVKLRKAQA